MKITFSSFNIGSCSDFSNYLQTNKIGDPNIEKTAEFIKTFNAQIIGLNEVYEDGPLPDYRNQTVKLANLIGKENHVFGLAKKFEWGDMIGNAILSDYIIKKYEFISVPAPNETDRPKNENEWYEDRVVVKATIDIGIEIAIYLTHFGLNICEQKNMVSALISDIKRQDKPFVLMGDFNALPDSDVLKPLYEFALSASQACGKKYDYTWASFAPERTLDYIFFSSDFKILSFNIINKVVSDHCPIIAQVEIDF